MRFSVFTPSHHSRYLKRLAESLARQSFRDFEWVIVPNGKNPASKEDIESLCAGLNLNIKVVPYPGHGDSVIGALKLFNCINCSGEILVEVDHDDELVDICLEELDKAFDEKTDFVYSNFCNVTQSGVPFKYGDGFGWLYRPFFLDGKEYEETLSFPPTPASCGFIWYAGNHVRAIRRSFYFEKVGGHDPKLDVLDDQDLIARSYIKGTMKHLDKCLYLYHVHDQAKPGEGNTCYGSKNAEIQKRTVDLYRKYIFQLCEKWADDNGLLKIDLCGGIDKVPGWTSIDIRGGDITCDLDGPWDLKSGSVGVIRAYNAMEHLKNPIHTMEEIYRVLAPNGYLLSLTPSTDSRAAFQDPTHVSFWNRNSFFYWCRASHAKYINTKARFREMLIEDVQYDGFDKIHNISFIRADLQKFEGRVPGQIYF